MSGIPVIDVRALRDGSAPEPVARAIDDACRDTGFFCITGHGVDRALRDRLDALAREFFALDDAEKAQIAMARGGRAWRGWFPVGGELTSGQPDLKEGIYFGQELAPDDPRVRAGRPMHGPNLFPARPAGLRDAVLEYLEQVTALGQDLLRGIAVGLGLDERWFAQNLTGDPLVLFRIFHYPPVPPGAPGWGVAEHTDYGLVTVLGQDSSGGLEVRGASGWLSVPADPDAFVVNIGDMLERMTGGVYRSTPHRVRNVSGHDRLSFPLFVDPSWDAEVRPLPMDRAPRPVDPASRWDGADVLAWSGTYGDYLLAKVGRVFPGLRDEVLGVDAPP